MGFSIVGPMTKKFGIVKTLKISFILGIIGNIVRCIFPASLPVTLGVALFTGFSTIPMMCLGGALNSMAIDYNDYLYHNKIVGMSASATSFGAKIASGLGASLIGWILAAVHYDASAAAATTSVRYGIYGFSIYLPLLMMVGLYLMIRKFDLEAKYPEMMAEIKARNEAEAATEKTVE